MTDHQQVREALEPCPFCGGAAHFFKIADLDDKNFGGEGICCGSCPITTDLMFSLMDDCKPLLAEKWNRRAPRLEAAAEYERGRQDGMKQEHALWKLAQAGQDIEAAADQKTGETNAQLDHDSNAAQPEQQRQLAGAVALGQSVGGGSDAGTGHPRAEGTQHVAAVPELSREDVVRLMREAGFANTALPPEILDHFQRFASLVRSVPVGEVKPVAITEDTAWNLAKYVYSHSNPHDSPQMLLSAMEIKSIIELAYRDATPPAPPKGWRMVPVEALTRWRDAFDDELATWDNIGPPPTHILRAMTSHDEIDAMLAAPQPGDK